jgi:hypothetical protein
MPKPLSFAHCSFAVSSGSGTAVGGTAVGSGGLAVGAAGASVTTAAGASVTGAVVGVAVDAQLAKKVNTIQMVKILKKIFITSSLQFVGLKMVSIINEYIYFNSFQ